MFVKRLRVLIGCEYSGVVRRAFRDLGHDAWSCDLLPSEDDSAFHLQQDVLPILGDGWDLAIFHPPCTHLAVSGARWFKDKLAEQAQALEFVRALLAAPIKMIALENPVSIISSKIRKPDQVLHTLAVWPRRDEGHMPLAEKPAEAGANEYRSGP